MKKMIIAMLCPKYAADAGKRLSKQLSTACRSDSEAGVCGLDWSARKVRWDLANEVQAERSEGDVSIARLLSGCDNR